MIKNINKIYMALMRYLTLVGFLHKFRLDKIFYTIVLIFIFSLIYLLFYNEEFAGWIYAGSENFSRFEKEKIDIFYKHAKKYISFLTKEEFINLPTIKRGNYLFLLGKHTVESRNIKNTQIRNLLFDINSSENRLKLNRFLDIPIHLTLYKKNPKTIERLPRVIEYSQKYAVRGYFDRLYYSTITQTGIGFGDIFPATERLRLVTMMQAISTIFIIIL